MVIGACVSAKCPDFPIMIWYFLILSRSWLHLYSTISEFVIHSEWSQGILQLMVPLSALCKLSRWKKALQSSAQQRCMTVCGPCRFRKWYGTAHKSLELLIRSLFGRHMSRNPTRFRKQIRMALGNIEGVRILTPLCATMKPFQTAEETVMGM